MTKQGIVWLNDQKHYISEVREHRGKTQVLIGKKNGRWRTVKREDIERLPSELDSVDHVC